MTGRTPIDSRGLTFMVIPASLFMRLADPLRGCPSAITPASSDVRALASMPIPLRTWASRSVEKRSPCDSTPSL